MWLSVPYSECPTPYSDMFCSRCLTWNSTFIRNQEDLSVVEKILLGLEDIEFKANVVICAFTGQRKSYSGWNSRQAWLSVPCSRCPSSENLAPVEVCRIQGKSGYPCLTPKALLHIAVCSAQDALLRIVSIYECPTPYSNMFCSGCSTRNNIYIRSWADLCDVENSGQEIELFGVRHLEQDIRLYGAIRSELQLSGVTHSEYQHYSEPGLI